MSNPRLYKALVLTSAFLFQCNEIMCQVNLSITFAKFTRKTKDSAVSNIFKRRKYVV